MPGSDQYESNIPENLDLIRGIREENKDAFEALFRLYFSRLCTFANGYVNSRDVSKDIVQAVFVRIWEKRRALDVQSSPRAYLYRSVRNLSLDYLKHRRIEHDREQLAMIENAHLEDPVEIIARDQMLDFVLQGIEELPERCRTVVKLHWIEGLTNHEVAAALNLSIKTVETQISRALKRLREELLPYLPIFLVIASQISFLD